jgi:hypothetical protein
MPDTNFLTRNISINLCVFINFAGYQIDELPVTVHGRGIYLSSFRSKIYSGIGKNV